MFPKLDNKCDRDGFKFINDPKYSAVFSAPNFLRTKISHSGFVNVFDTKLFSNTLTNVENKEIFLLRPSVHHESNCTA